MDESKAIEYLMHFGMSRQEATVYLRLIEAGKQTGYEIARDTGISRSNVYASLAALVEKGAAYLVEEDAKRYIPVHVQEFCGNRPFRFMAAFEGDVPGASEVECGNYRDMDLPAAKAEAAAMLPVLEALTADELHY